MLPRPSASSPGTRAVTAGRGLRRLCGRRSVAVRLPRMRTLRRRVPGAVGTKASGRNPGLSDRDLGPPCCLGGVRGAGEQETGGTVIFLQGGGHCPGSFFKGSAEITLFTNNKNMERNKVQSSRHSPLPGAVPRVFCGRPG